MSASEPSPLAANLQESIEHLVAETVRRSQTDLEVEQQKLRVALQQALAEIQSGQAAMNRAADVLQAALDTQVVTPITPDGAVEEVTEDSVVAESVEPTPVEAVVAEPVAGPHELDVIAHDVSIGTATGLQSMLRGREEVTSAQTREFVNGELRLKLEMNSALGMSSFKEWVAEHGGRVATQTNSVIELRFGE